MSAAPYLTVVTCSRNDDYGGGILPRLQLTLEILRQQLEQQRLDAELILVEWNPPPDRPLLAEALTLPARSPCLSVRALEVPAEIHCRYRHADRHPLHGAVAFNAALRRARGEFTVYRVSDLIWSDEIVAAIAARRLEDHTKYRCTRADVDAGILDLAGAGLEQVMAYCSSHITMVMKKIPYYARGLPRLRLNSDGDFQLLSSAAYRGLRGYQETDSVNSPNVDGLLEHCAWAAGIRDELWEDRYVYKIDNPHSYRHRTLRSLLPGYDRLRARLPGFAVNSLMIQAARRAGITGLLYDRRRVRVRGIEMPTRREYYDLCRRIVSGEVSYLLNGPDWGLADRDLRERRLTRADWESR